MDCKMNNEQVQRAGKFVHLYRNCINARVMSINDFQVSGLLNMIHLGVLVEHLFDWDAELAKYLQLSGSKRLKFTLNQLVSNMNDELLNNKKQIIDLNLYDEMMDKIVDTEYEEYKRMGLLSLIQIKSEIADVKRQLAPLDEAFIRHSLGSYVLPKEDNELYFNKASENQRKYLYRKLTRLVNYERREYLSSVISEISKKLSDDIGYNPYFESEGFAEALHTLKRID